MDIKVKREYHDPSARTIVLTMVLAFVVPVLIMAFAFLKIQVWPGGKFTLYTYDMRGQFNAVIASLRYINRSDASLFLSFGGALANNAYLNSISYIVDPIMWITVLFPIDRLPDAIYYITLFKIGLCGMCICAYFYFGTRSKKHPIIILVLSTCYALMSYNIMYSQCILWFNVVALAPLVLIGVERIIQGKRGGVYIVCMTLSLYYNYQLAYMIGIFAILYLTWRLSEGIGDLKKIIRFIICNVLSAGLIMPVFIPVLFNVMSGRMQTDNNMMGQLFYYSLGDVLNRFLSCRYSTIESEGLPLVFIGTFIPPTALASVLLPVKKLHTRMISLGIIVFFIASFCIVPLNQFWHGFNEPNSFPARYSFLLCLFLLVLAYDTLCFAMEKIVVSRTLHYLFYGIALTMTVTEMYLNAGYILTSLNLETEYAVYAGYQLNVRGTEDLLNRITDKDFYRVGRDITVSLNDGMLFGYNGIGYFSSMFERNTMDLLGRMGYSQSEHTLMDVGGTPLSESLLGVKYKILKEPGMFGYYESLYQNGLYELQYNRNALPLGFLIDYNKFDPQNDEELASEIRDHDSLAYQEYILSELRGERVRAYDRIEYSKENVDSDEYARDIKMRFVAKDDKPVWFFVRDDYNGTRVAAPDPNKTEDEDKTVKTLLTVNGESIIPFADGLSTLCVCLGTYEPGEDVVVEAACSNYFDDPWIAYYNEEECEDALRVIRNRGFEVTEHKNGVIKGSINVEDDDDLLVMTLPFMKGYRVFVDGKRTDYGAYRNSLFALKMEPGEHMVEISYIPYGFIPGAAIGLISLVLVILYIRTSKKHYQ